MLAAVPLAANLYPMATLVAVNRDFGRREKTKEARGVVIHGRDLGDPSVCSGGLDAAISTRKEENSRGAGLTHLGANRVARCAKRAGHAFSTEARYGNEYTVAIQRFGYTLAVVYPKGGNK